MGIKGRNKRSFSHSFRSGGSNQSRRSRLKFSIVGKKNGTTFRERCSIDSTTRINCSLGILYSNNDYDVRMVMLRFRFPKYTLFTLRYDSFRSRSMKFETRAQSIIDPSSLDYY